MGDTISPLGPLAQLAEQVPFKHKVTGSIPVRPIFFQLPPPGGVCLSGGKNRICIVITYITFLKTESNVCSLQYYPV